MLLLLATPLLAPRASAVAVVLYKNAACVDSSSVESLYAALTALGYSVTNTTSQPALNAASQAVSRIWLAGRCGSARIGGALRLSHRQ